MLALLLCFSASFVPASAERNDVRIYVSAKGTAHGDGSVENPYSTLEEARDAIREMKKNGEYPETGVTVMIREGSYYFTESFELGEEDSGEEGAPVVWRAYPGEDVSLIGGGKLKMSDFSLLEDNSVLSKMDSSVVGKIYWVSFDDMGIEPYDELNVTGHSSYYTVKYGLSEEGLSTPELYYNGEVMYLAQYPDHGEYMEVGEVTDKGENMSTWYSSTDPNKGDAPTPGTFKVDDDRISRWKNADSAWVFGYWQYDWSDQTMPVAKIDTDEKTITPGLQTYYTMTSGQRFYIYNLIEELTAPGEWYLDKKTNILYVYPYDSDPDSTISLGFSSNPVITITGAKHIQIRDIEVTCSRSCGINIADSENIALSYMSINGISGEGIIMEGKNLTVEGCHIHTLGKKGIDSFGGDFETLEPSGNKMINNHIHDFGRLVTTYEGGIKCNDVGALIKNNLIYNGTHLAINVKGNDNIVEYNDIHDVLKTSSDMGAVYSGQTMVQRGNIIRYNLIHDLTTDSSQISTHSIIGIYLDDMYSGTEIYGNILYNIDGNAVFINGGRNNSIRHNIIANCNYALTLSPAGISWGREASWENGSSTYGLKGDNTVPYTGEAYSKYDNLADILDDDPLMPKYNVYDENLLYNVENELDIRVNDTGYKVSDIRSLGTINDGLQTAEDIGFKNLSGEDFGLKDDSEFYEKYPEFEKIDSDRIGLVSSQLKGLLKDGSVALAIGKPVSYANWSRKLIDSDNIDVVPFMRDNKTYVPLRFLSESFGATVEWKDGAAYIDYNGTEYVFKSGSNEVLADGVKTELEAAVITENGRNFLPLRDVSELFGKEVYWNDCGLVVVSNKNLEKYMNEDRVYDLYNRM